MRFRKRLLSILLLTALVAALIPLTAAEAMTGSFHPVLPDPVIQPRPIGVNEVSGDYTYEVYDGEAVITGYSGTAANLVIPSELGGCPVVGIEEQVFWHNQTLQSVVFPDSVTWIGAYTFWDCGQLSDVQLPSGLTELGYKAFGNCESLTRIWIPKSLTNGGSHWNSGERGAFNGCVNLKTVTFEEGISVIPDSLFAGSGVETIVIPDSVTTIGPCAFQSAGSLKKVTLGSGVLTIESEAFQGCTALTELDFGESLTTIGENAFWDCTALTEVAFPDTVTGIYSYAFWNCKKLADVRLSANLTELGYKAFGNCESLTQIWIPKSLTNGGSHWNSVERGAFNGCVNLKTVTFEEGISVIPDSLFAGSGVETIVIPDSVITIGPCAFQSAGSLKKVTLGSGVLTIETEAFQGCTALTDIDFGESLTTIGENAFWDCTALTEVTFPDTVTDIYSYAFWNCKKLADVRLSANLTELGYKAFGNCESLTQIWIPKSLTNGGSHWNSVERGAFNGCVNLKTVTFAEGISVIPDSLFAGSGVETIVIPDTVVTIGSCAFQDAVSLKTVTLGSGVLTIESEAFRGCTALTDIDFGESLSTIGENAFWDCTALTEVTFPDTVTGIYSYAFWNCKKLADVRLSANLTELGNKAFGNCESLTQIWIPKSLTNGGYHWNPSEMGAFRGCENLKTVTFAEGIPEIPECLFAGSGIETIVIPDSVVTIGSCAFQDAVSLKKVTLGSGVLTIESEAFRGCTALTEVDFGESLTAIGENAFCDCTSLQSVELPDSVTELDNACFYNCASLETVKLPENLTWLADELFCNCASLETVTIPDAVQEINEAAFRNCAGLKTVALNEGLLWIGRSAFENCDALTSVEIPDTVTEMGGYAFNDCDALVSAVIPGSMESYSDHWFADCNALTDVTLCTGLTRIPSNCFIRCVALETVAIPSGVLTIEEYAFAECVKLKEVRIPRTTGEIASNAFSYPGSMTIYGVDGCYAQTFAEENGIRYVVEEINAQSISLNETELIMDTGTAVQLLLTVEPAGFTDAIVWKSSNTDVATVNDKGIVQAVGTGTTTIKVTVGKLSASCSVEVVQGVTYLWLSEWELTLEALEAFTLYAEVDEDAYNRDVIWTTSDPSVATVDENGKVTGIGKGTAEIIAACAANEDIQDSCTVTVINNGYVVDTPEELESPHNYPDSSMDVWLYTEPGADAIELTFDERTMLEEGFDYLVIYWLSEEGYEELGTYTGDELAGQTIEIPGDTVKLQLLSDDSGNEWGFKVESGRADGGGNEDGGDHQHDFEEEVYEPDCTEGGYTEYTCTICDYSYTDDYTDPIGHDYESEYYEPTCEYGGYTEYICVNCGDGYEETDGTDPIDHEYEAEVYEPDCTEGGYTEHTCIYCGDCYESDFTEPLGHDWDEGEIVVEPTTDSEGEILYTCRSCGEERSEVLAPVVHEHDYSYRTTVVEPTCTSGGYTTHTCECGDSYDDSFTEALGHQFGEWTVQVAPSCTEGGSESRSCGVCSASEGRELPPAGHNFVQTVTEPTCTQGGYTTSTCTNCAESRVDNYTDPLDHDLGEWHTTVLATCTTGGEERRGCSRCDYQQTRTTQPTGHQYESTVTEPTCTLGGYTTHTCACGDSYTSDPTEPLNHDLGQWYAVGDGVCTMEHEERRDCSRCEFHESRTVPPTGHNYEDVVIPPTCLDHGYTTHTCVTCGHRFVDGFTPVTDHLWDAGQVIREPDANGPGQILYTCTVCATTRTEEYTGSICPFTDVAQDAYYFQPVLWAVEQGITSGTSATTFSPDQTCTRAQVVTFLWRAMGKPEPTRTDNPFTDVASGDYFYSAVLWAVENGITAGTSATTFAPNNPCTRAQVVTFLWRAVGKPEPTRTDNPFTDVAPGDYFYSAVLWAVENGITAGTSATTFAPNNPCTRGQVVTFLYRAYKEE